VCFLSLPCAAEDWVHWVHTGQIIIPCTGVSKFAPRVFGLLTFIKITIILNYIFAEKLIPHFNLCTFVTLLTLGNEHKMEPSFACSFKVPLLKQTGKQIVQSLYDGQY